MDPIGTGTMNSDPETSQEEHVDQEAAEPKTPNMQVTPMTLRKERRFSGQSQESEGRVEGSVEGRVAGLGGGDSASGEPLGGVVSGSQGVGDDSDKRKRKLNDKGRGYLLQIKERALNNAHTQWRGSAARAEKTLGTESVSIVELKAARDSLECDIVLLSDAQHELTPIADAADIADLERGFDSTEAKNQVLMQRLTDRIRDVQLEVSTQVSISSIMSGSSQSRKSHKSKHSSRSHKSCSSRSSCSSTSSKRAAAEAEAAALQAKLKYLDAEARQKAELQRTKTAMKLEMANAKVKALRKHEEAVASSDATVTLNPEAAPFAPQEAVRQSFDSCTENWSESQQTAALTRSIVQQMNISRLPPPEPGVFSGDPISYPGWKAAFDTLIGSRGIPAAERIHYLRRYLAGQAKEAVEGYLLLASDEAYDHARALLDRRFGDAFSVAGAFRDKLEDWKPLANNGRALRKLSDFLQQCVVAKQTNSSLAILDDERENQRILSKLPEWLVRRWGRVAAASKRQHGTYPTFAKFAEFLEQEADILCDSVTGTLPTKPSTEKQSKQQGKDKRSAGSFNTTAHPTVTCQNCDVATHSLKDCRKFRQLDIEKRRAFVKERQLCFGCLTHGHRSRECRQRLQCETCSKGHPTCLHEDREPRSEGPPNSTKRPDRSSGKASDSGKKDEEASAPKVHSGFSGTNRKAAAKSSMIVPVMVSHKDNPGVEIEVYAMLDTQSDTTFVYDKTREDLSLEGTQVQLRLSTLSAEDELINSRRIDGLLVRGINSDKRISLPTTYTRDIMPVDRTHIPCPDTAKRWPHLERVAEHLSPIRDCEVGLLIGYNCPKALTPREVIAHHDSGPYAQKTDLGWSIVGTSCPAELEGDPIGISHRVLSHQLAVPHQSSIILRSSIKEVKGDAASTGHDAALQQVIRMMERDFTEQDSEAQQKMSQEDFRFLKIIREGISIGKEGRYEMPLPFKCENTELPNNRAAAVHRLEQLKKRLQKCQNYHEAYVEFMDKMISKGHAEKVPPDELNKGEGQVWFVPHHGVYHPKKPDKLRVVFDCSATYNGTSLNKRLLQGPDLTNKLVGVLARFRQETVAFTCDVEAMFYQFMVRDEDKDFLRFLWWDQGNLDSRALEYRMNVHLFGAVSSPACAMYALRQIAIDHDKVFSPEVTNFIKRDFYIDDGLKSTDSVDKAVQIALQSSELCSKGGLRLHKFLSNSRQVLRSLPEEDHASNISSRNLTNEAIPTERVLGVQWDTERDTFGFQIQIDPKQHLTRRGILSVVSSIYDPLGLASPVILVGKQILQELCRGNKGWDDPIPEEIRPRWEKWKSELDLLENVRVNRCYKPADFGTVEKVELHHFADASLSGYGECSYLRLVNQEGRVHCALVMSKARVIPLKTITVPRLELTAAVTAVRVSLLLEKELDYANMEHFFWSDSQVVLGYINNETTRFHIFVANRVQLIRNHSDKTQWHHVPTEQNPADLASRGCSPSELLQSSVWFNGPSMLWEASVPFTQSITVVREDDPEVRKRCMTSCSEPVNFLVDNLQKFSTWVKMKRVIGRCLSIKRILSGEMEALPPTVSELRRAERIIVQIVQQSCFKNDINQLERSKTVPSNSSIAKLDPFLDEEGTLRVGGRLTHGNLPQELKHPVLLPKDHHVTKTILRHFHEKVAHQGRGMTINALRTAGYWAIGASRSVASLISQCVTCRRIRSQACEQKMADLPVDRVDPAPPFTYVGVDYFGPFYIREGRKELKRWGAIFTCMASRAVHLEVATSMTTDGFINVLRRFVSLRGPVRQLRSDRGTNFVGAERELQQALEEIEDDKIQSFLAENMCEFIFNPPHASHMGGVWERQIRTTRNILNSLLQESGKQLDDDSLRTLMAEAASIMNSRPLTIDNLNDPKSMVPITPNQLLTMKTSVVVPPPGNFKRADSYSKKRWRRVQHLSNIFWSRWRLEFLTQLQRQKWSRPQRNLIPGDVVLLKDDALPRSQWRLGRVHEAVNSDDGLTRKVKVEIGDPTLDNKGKRKRPVSIMERPIHKLILLVETPDILRTEE